MTEEEIAEDTVVEIVEEETEITIGETEIAIEDAEKTAAAAAKATIVGESTEEEVHLAQADDGISLSLNILLIKFIP